MTHFIKIEHRVELELTRPVTTKTKEEKNEIIYLPKNTVKARVGNHIITYTCDIK